MKKKQKKISYYQFDQKKFFFYLFLYTLFSLVLFFLINFTRTNFFQSVFIDYLLIAVYIPVIFFAYQFKQRLYYIAALIVGFIVCIVATFQWDTSPVNTTLVITIISAFTLFSTELVYQLRRTVNELAHSKKIAYALLNAPTDSAILIDRLGKILAINVIGAQRFGKTIQDMIGSNLWEAMPEIVAKSRLAYVDQLLETKSPVRFEDMREDIIFDSQMYPILDEDGHVSQIAIYARNVTNQKKAEQELYYLATTDELTNLNNRRNFLEHFEQNINFCQRYKHDLCFLMLDIDHFKFINDTYGHQAGDEVLIRLANFLKTSLRITDVIGRLGGEEFGIILPETSIVHAKEIAERLRKKIELLVIPYNDISLSLTVSIGVSSIENEDADANLLIKNADIALYEAKQNGRNQVRVYTEEEMVREQ